MVNGEWLMCAAREGSGAEKKCSGASKRKRFECCACARNG